MKNKSINNSENLQALFDFYEITAQAKPQIEENIVSIDGVIGWDVTGKDIADKLSEFSGKSVRIDISSPGGFVFEGLRIFNLIRNHNGETTTRLVGLAASMASYIALAADNVTAEDNAIYMIHNARGVAFGDQNDMRKTADLIDRISGMLAQEYIKKTGKTEKEVREMMDSETFLFGSEMLKEGFVDKIIKTDKKEGRESALGFAHEMIKECSAKMKESENSTKDIEKVAAILSNSETTAPTEPPQTGLINNAIDQIPAANAGQQPEENNMSLTLKELLAQNPAAKIEFEKALEDSRAEGFNKSETEIKARIESATVFLGKDSVYPQTIKNQAIQVITGELPLSALQAAVSGHDATIEALKSSGAIAENAQIAETPAQQVAAGTQITGNGEIKNEADVSAVVASLKSAVGGVV
jgi:ATP-dependent protease ClpP protease subunit